MPTAAAAFCITAPSVISSSHEPGSRPQSRSTVVWWLIELAADRTLLASERTYAAWLRTGLAALAAGIGAQKLLEALVQPWLVMAASIVLILLAEFCFVAGVWRQLSRSVPPPRPDVPMMPGWLLIVFNGFLTIVGAAVLIGIVTR